MAGALRGAQRDIDELVKGGEGTQSSEDARRAGAVRAKLDLDGVSSR
jgi:hypothetical protein